MSIITSYEKYIREHSNVLDDDLLYILEATNDSFFIISSIYPKIESVLKTPSGDAKFNKIIGSFIDRNSVKLHTPGPQYLIPFTERDKDEYFELFNVSRQEVVDIVKKVVNTINAQADWKLLTGNPIFVIFFCCIRYYTLKKNNKGLNGSLAALSLSMYPSIFTKYYTYEPNKAVMQYTIDNLSNKFNIKKSKHIFGNIMMSIQQSWSFHKSNIEHGSDKNVIDFIMRIRNDQNSFMKKISHEYFTNHANNMTVYNAIDSFDDNSVVDIENDSNRVEAVTDKITMAIMINGVDLRLAEASAKGSHVSVIDTRNYLNNIVTEKNSNDMKSFIESILFLYLYTGKKTIREINSRYFLEFSLSLYKKTNSKDDNIINIKNILDKWGEEIGLHAHTKRQATINDYKRAIYTFFIFSIQKYNQ